MDIQFSSRVKYLNGDGNPKVQISGDSCVYRLDESGLQAQRVERAVPSKTAEVEVPLWKLKLTGESKDLMTAIWSIRRELDKRVAGLVLLAARAGDIAGDITYHIRSFKFNNDWELELGVSLTPMGVKDPTFVSLQDPLGSALNTMLTGHEPTLDEIFADFERDERQVLERQVGDAIRPGGLFVTKIALNPRTLDRVAAYVKTMEAKTVHGPGWVEEPKPAGMHVWAGTKWEPVAVEEELDAAFDIGQLVYLVSGGPTMTVADIFTDEVTEEPTYVCRWFDKNMQLQTGDFSEEELEAGRHLWP